MSKSRLLGVKDTLHLLGNLQEALKDCAARETKLENEYRARSGAELRRHEAALAELDSEQATRLNQADEQANAEKARLQQAFERRQAGIADVNGQAGGNQAGFARMHRQRLRQTGAQVQTCRTRRRVSGQRNVLAQAGIENFQFDGLLRASECRIEICSFRTGISFPFVGKRFWSSLQLYFSW